MRKTIIKYLIFLALTYTYLGCVKQDAVSSIQTMETTKIVNEAIIKDVNKKNAMNSSGYGQHTNEIQEFLSATPMGSEIYLEEKESGEWYLKIEKTFTVKKDEEKTEMIKPIYGESILI